MNTPMKNYYESQKDMKYYNVRLLLEDGTHVDIEVGSCDGMSRDLEHCAAQSDLYTCRPLDIIGSEITEVV